MKFLRNLPTYLLALIFIGFFIQFVVFMVKMPAMPSMGALADQFGMVMFMSGYMWIVKILEVIFALMMFVPRIRPLALILIAPIIVNIFLYEVLIIEHPGFGIIPVIIIVLLEIIALYQHRASYLPMVRGN